MQGAIEMGFSLPNTENFPAFFENIKFGHQNMLLSTFTKQATFTKKSEKTKQKQRTWPNFDCQRKRVTPIFIQETRT